DICAQDRPAPDPSCFCASGFCTAEVPRCSGRRKRRRKSSSSAEKKRRERPPPESLHGNGVPVVEQVQEKRRSNDTHGKRSLGDTVTPRSPRSPRRDKERAREEHRPRQQYQYQYPDVHRNSDSYRPPMLNVQVPNMWHRTVDSDSTNSSQETLLNPRPHRSPHHRQAHPKHTSQTTLRGRGAKRDPPRHSKSKTSSRHESSRAWSFFASSPPKTPTRRDHHYQTTLESSPRSHRSTRSRQPTRQSQQVTEASPSQSRHHRSRQHIRQPQSTHGTRSRTPNMAARRAPDRRFAVLAATNQALEDLRREAFAQPSPPPRRERLQRYQGVQIPSSTIPFNWDCVSSSQTSPGRGGESSTRHRRSSR
ncbi:hypothetical protein K504DRAFT_347456, partial [Pleomassaria siparia CBS 279.74]